MTALYWDYQLLSYLAFCFIIIYATVSRLRKNWSTYKLFKKFALMLNGAFFVFGTIMLLYGSFVEPYLIKIKTIHLQFNKTSETETLRIVQISDLHPGPFKQSAYFNSVAQKILALQPDLVVMTGDFNYTRAKDANYLYALEPLTMKINTYAVTGNHEYGQSSWQDKIKDQTEPLKKIFHDIDIFFIDNTYREIETKHGRFLLVGLQDVWSNPETNEIMTRAKRSSPENLPKILLSHNPDIILEPAANDFDLILSGHTHGGQICLPGFGSLVRLPTKLSNYYDRGLFNLPDEGRLYINSGIGESGPRARLFNHPEITVFEIDL